MFTTIALAALASIQVSAYSLCNPNQYRLKGQTVKNVPILSSGTFQNAKGESVSVAGTITVVDGCSFSVSGLTFTGVDSASFYGGVGDVGPNSPSVHLIADTINAPKSPISQTYTFITSAGAAVSYADFDQFRLFDPTSQLLIGIANIPAAGSVTGSGGSVTGSGNSTSSTTRSSATSTASSSTATSTVNSNAESVVGSSLAMVAALFLMA